MEITAVPHRPPVVGRLWLVVVATLVTPVILLVMVPAGLGLHRFVITNDDVTGLSRGTLLFSHEVPGSDLRPGDVIVFAPPAGYGVVGLVTRRVATIDGDRLRTRDDDGIDPWGLQLAGHPHDRMVVDVPWVGYPFSGDVGRGTWSALAGVAVLAVLLALARDLRRVRRRPTSTPPAAAAAVAALRGSGPVRARRAVKDRIDISQV